MSSYQFLNISFVGGLVTVEIDCPPANVLDLSVMRELDGAVAEASGNKNMKVLMITAAGGKLFSAGVDVVDHTPDKVDEMIDVFHGMIRRIRNCPVPTVAALSGAALGGGCELAIACDMVLARENSKIGQPEIQLGVFPPIAAVLLPRLMPETKAFELLLSGGLIKSDEAVRLGLVNHVYPKETFEADCQAFVGRFLSLSRVALLYSKRAIREASGKSFDQALTDLEEIYLKEMMATEDAVEGLNSFMEKRPPVWVNK